MFTTCQLKLTMGASHSKNNPENNKIDLKLQKMSLLGENKKEEGEKDSLFNTYIFPDKNRNYPSDLEEDDPDVEKTRLTLSLFTTVH